MTSGAVEHKSAGTAILLTLTMILSTWGGFLATNELHEVPTPAFSIGTSTVSNDAQTNSSLPTNNYGAAENLMVGDTFFTDARMLVDVPLTTAVGGPMAPGSIVSHATLDLSCVQYPNAPSGASMIYAARLHNGFNESAATFNISDTNANWTVPGADGVDTDRTAWEPYFSSSASSFSASINVTSLVQDAMADGDTNISLIVSAVGIAVVCKSSEHPSTSLRPKLSLVFSTGSLRAAGDIQKDSPADGEILIEPTSLLIAPDLTPSIGWKNLTGTGVDIQFSLSDDFRNSSDGDWHWTSWQDASDFDMSGELFTTPSSDLTNGSWVYYRMRTANGTTLGDWVSGYFGLPSDSMGSLNFNQDAEIELRSDNIGLGTGTVHDTWIRSGNTSFNGASDTRMRVGESTDSNESTMRSIVEFELQNINLHQNATIIDATLNLRRTDRSGDPIVSVHLIDSPTNMNASNWTHNGDGTTWNASDDLLGEFVFAHDGNQSYATLTWDVTTWVQDHTTGGSTDSLAFLVTVSGITGEEIEFGTSEEAFSYRPHLDIEYTWGDGVATAGMADVTPVHEATAWTMDEWNLTSSTSPTLSWNTSTVSGGDVIVQLAPAEDYETVLTLSADSRTDSGFDLTAGTFEVPAQWGLLRGERFAWRVQWVDGDERGPFHHSINFISELNSTYLGGGEYELRLSDGNASSSNLGLTIPDCGDTFIESGSVATSNFEDNDIIVSSTQVGLIGCSLAEHRLPDGLAVVAATLRMKTDAWAGITNTLQITVHESSQDAWDADGATWNTYDGTQSWNAAGASGTERVQALDTVSVSSDGTWYEWNVTMSVQNAMRWGLPANFIVTSSSSAAAIFTDSQGGSNAPELVITYTNGSNAAPATPIGLAPDQGAWQISGDIMYEVAQQPTLNWTGSSSPAVNGWQVQMDTEPTLNSQELREYASWIETGAFSGTTVTPTTDLTDGETWYWRVRGITATGQVGNWSAVADFVVPKIDVSRVDADTYEIVIDHEGALPDDAFPTFTDTYVDGTQANRNTTHGGSEYLFASAQGPQTALISIPIAGVDSIPTPSQARLSQATFSIYVIGNNSSDPRVSIHEVLSDWTEAATGWSTNGTLSNASNWTTPGARSDLGDFTDITTAISPGAYVHFDVTRIAQNALDAGADALSLGLMVDPGTSQEVQFASVDYPYANSRPQLTLAWSNGTAAVPSTAATLTSPGNNDITWDTSGHALLAEDQPTLTWSHPDATNISDWRVFFYVDNADARDGYTVYDSRTDAGFNGLSFTPTSALDADAEYRWFVQPVNDDMRGPMSSDSRFLVPNDVGSDIDGTNATIELRNGNVVTSTGAYDLMQGAGMDGCNTGSNAGLMYIGYSPAGGGCSAFEWRSLLRIDLSAVPIPEPWEVGQATVSMYKNSGSTWSTPVGVAAVHCDWVESQVTWNNCASNTAWSAGGASDAADADRPVDIVNLSSTGWYTWDVTPLLQAARVAGTDELNLMFTSQDPNLVASMAFANEDHTNIGLRPAVNITYRTGTQWVPAPVGGHNPASDTTMWDITELLPTPVDPITLAWTHPAPSNITDWEMQISTHENYAADVHTLHSSDSNSYNGTFDLTNLEYELPSGISWPDSWVHWRVRAHQDGRIGNWTDGGAFRVPTAQGSDDGAGNYTVTMYRGAIFEDSGALPTAPDAWLDSSTMGSTANRGATGEVYVGQSPYAAGADAVGLVTFDLDEYPFPSTILPTGVTLRMYMASATGGTGAHSVGIHSCYSYDEMNVRWSNYNPNTQCASSASSAMTATSTQNGVWYEWDVTNLARNAVNGNGEMVMGLMTNWSGTLQFVSADNSSSGNGPQLVFDYVDNPSGATPPAQASLISPANLEVVYDEDGYLLTSATQPTLTWGAVSGATGYILRLSNATTSTTYWSWNSSGFTGASWTPNFDLEAGGVYSWDVQAIAGSIPGARSSAWAFAIADPTTSSLGNHVYTAEVIEGGDAAALNHPQVHDTHISEGLPNEAAGNEEMEIGVGCDGAPSNTNLCLGLYSVDMSQLPLHANVNPHSARLSVYMDSLEYVSGASYLDITAYALTNANFDESGATWNDAAYGTAWNGVGASGADRGTVALDTVTIPNSWSNGWLRFDISGALTSTNGVVAIVLVPSVTSGQFGINVAHSEHSSAWKRPVLDFNYTTVDSVQITGPATTDADTAVSFTADLYDALGGSLTGSVSWTSSDGSIDVNGQFTPQNAGNVTITAAYGQVMVEHYIMVEAGAPVTLVVNPLNGFITADDTLDITLIEVRDQYGNPVDGETVTFALTNGSLAPGLSVTTPVTGGVIFSAWASGPQWINATWGSQTVAIPVTVDVGAPSYYIVDGCANVDAGTACSYTWTLWDAHDNQLPEEAAGTQSWAVEDGSIDANGQFTADTVGVWNITLSDSNNIEGMFVVTVDHGAIADLEVVAEGGGNILTVTSGGTLESLELTADDSVTFTVTRIDVRGNRLAVDLPLAGWTWSNGTFDAGPPAVWQPWRAAPQYVEATLESVSTNVPMTVTNGEPVSVEARATVATLVSGETTTVNAYASDASGNQWSIVAEDWQFVENGAEDDWMYEGPTYADFTAALVGDWTIRLVFVFQNENGMQTLLDTVAFTVTPGALDRVEVADESLDITADDTVSMNPQTWDAAGNLLATDMLTIWQGTDASGPECNLASGWVDITTEMQADGFVWEASDVGEHILCAAGPGILPAKTSVSVSVGQAVQIWHVAKISSDAPGTVVNAVSSIAADDDDRLTVAMWARDSDGNEFPVAVDWASNSADMLEQGQLGHYMFIGTTNKTYDLAYTNGSLSGSWEVTVAYGKLHELRLMLSAPGANPSPERITVEQQTTVTITISGYDTYGNAVPLPPTALTFPDDADDLNTASPGTDATQWTAYMLAEGSNTVTVNAGLVTKSAMVDVTGNIGGFYEANAPLSYIGTALFAIIVLSIVIVLVVLIRRAGGGDDDEFDDDDEYEDDDEDDYPATPSRDDWAESDSSEEEYSAEEDPNYRVDEDGTEWWQDDEGVWWYRDPDMEDWAEWTE